VARGGFRAARAGSRRHAGPPPSPIGKTRSRSSQTGALSRRNSVFPRHLSRRSLSGHVGIRKSLVQPAQPEDRPSDQIRQGRCRHREEVANEDIVKGYKVDTDTFVEVTKEELENVALESTRTIEIDEFVDRREIDPRYLIRPYYLRPDGKVGHDAFAVIRETIREIDKVAIGRVCLRTASTSSRSSRLCGKAPTVLHRKVSRCCACRARAGFPQTQPKDQ
jgi:hypothetical protein